MSDARRVDSKLARAKGMEIVDGWVRYAVDSKARKVMPTEGGDPGWAIEGEALEFAGLTDEAKLAHSLEKDRSGTMVFSVKDLDCRHRVEALIYQLKLEGVSCTSLRELLIAVHYKGAELHRIQLRECPPFVSGANAIGLSMVFVLQRALSEFYSRLGRIWFSEQGASQGAGGRGQSAVADFVAARCIGGRWVPATELFHAYIEWFLASGVDPSFACSTQTAFGRAMSALGYTRTKSAVGWFYDGLCLVCSESQEPAEASKALETCV